MKNKKKSSALNEPPLLVMAIEGGWFGDSKHQCLFAAIRLPSSVIDTLQAISEVSHDLGGTELLIGYWPVIWDQEQNLRIEKTVWRVNGHLHWAEAFNTEGQPLGRTIDFDTRTLQFMDGSLIWHATESASMHVEDLLEQPFKNLATERLIDSGLLKMGNVPADSQAEIADLLVELTHQST